MENNNYKVYVHANKVNGKRYVGITSTPLKRRFDNGLGYSSTTIFGRAIQKYGFDGFTHYILFDNLTKQEAERIEKEYIAKWHTQDTKYGYNGTAGGEGYLQHGGSGTRLYKIWTGVQCRNHDVCEEWKDFSVFREWALSHGYDDSKRIYRYNLDGQFNPRNCKWASRSEVASHAHDKSKRLLTYNNETHTLTEWSKIVGINKQTLQYRLDELHWDIERTLSTSTCSKPRICSNQSNLPHHISKHRNKYEACVQLNDKRFRKSFNTIEEAITFRDDILDKIQKGELE